MFDIIALGEILIDFTPHGVSEGGMNLYEENPGGAPANVLVAAQRLGNKTAFIGKVGTDLHGKLLKRTLEKDGINTQSLIEDPNYYTTLAFVALNNGERSFSFARKPGADTKLTKDELSIELLENTKVFHYGSLSLTDEPSRSATIFAIEHAKQSGALISYDPNYRALLWDNKEEAKKQMRSVISYADIIKISDEETELLTDFVEPELAANELIKQGVSCVIVTLGKNGALMKTKNFTVEAKGKERNIIDTTGAGDAFCGGLLSRFVQYKVKPEDLTKEQGLEFLQFANATAGLCVETRGGIPAMPALEEVQKDLKEL